jgi:hypothetical protein
MGCNAGDPCFPTEAELNEAIRKRDTELERYEETIKMIRSVCVDYKEQPSLGLVAIETLCKGVSGGKRQE